MDHKISPILLASPYKEKVQQELKNDSDWAKLFTGHHLEPGIVTYDNEDGSKTTYLLTREAIAKMRKSAEGKPIVGRSGNYDHKKVQPTDFVEGEVDGVVVESFDNPESGWEDVRFLVWDKDTKSKCLEGFQLSCAYVPTETDDTPGLWHNCPYDAIILNGEYTHVAVVPNPRYEGATILANSLKGGIVDNMLKAVLKCVPLPKLKEVLNSLEADAKNAATPVDFDKTKCETCGMCGKSPCQAIEVSAGVFESQGKTSTAPRKNADDAPRPEKPELPLGGGDVTPDPSLVAAGVETSGSKIEKVDSAEVKKDTPATQGAPAENTPPVPEDKPAENTPPVPEEKPAENTPALEPKPEEKPNAPEPVVEENAMDAGELREHIATTFTQELISGSFSPALQALLEKGAKVLGWDVKRYADQARSDARVVSHGMPNAVEAEVPPTETQNAVSLGEYKGFKMENPKPGFFSAKNPSGLTASGSDLEQLKLAIDECSAANGLKNTLFQFKDAQGEAELIEAKDEATAWEQISKDFATPVEACKKMLKVTVLQNRLGAEPETEVDVVKWFEAAFGRKPESDPSYFAEWKERWQKGPRDFMSSGPRAIFDRMKGIKNSVEPEKTNDKRDDAFRKFEAYKKEVTKMYEKQGREPRFLEDDVFQAELKKMEAEKDKAMREWMALSSDPKTNADEKINADPRIKKGVAVSVDPDGDGDVISVSGDKVTVEFSSGERKTVDASKVTYEESLNATEVCPSCTGAMKVLGNMDGVTHSQCEACGELVHSGGEEKVNSSDLCPDCHHSAAGHNEFGCSEKTCTCISEVRNTRSVTVEESGRKRWDSTPVNLRTQLLNSIHRRQPGDVALSFWSRRNWDELSNSIRQDLMKEPKKS